jgi:prophage antirepressor-like protein
MNDLITTALVIPDHVCPGRFVIRAEGTRDEPMFCLADVCKSLGISNSRMAADRLDDDEKGVRQTDTPGGPQQMTFVTESGFYAVILRSDKPQAQPLRRWVTREVLPSIRKHGCYPPPGSQNYAASDTVLARIEAALAALAQAREEREAELAGGDLYRRLAALEARLALPADRPRPIRRRAVSPFAGGRLQAAVLDHLKSLNGDGMRCPDLADALDAKEDSVRTVLHRHRIAGRVFKKGRHWHAAKRE